MSDPMTSDALKALKKVSEGAALQATGLLEQQPLLGDGSRERVWTSGARTFRVTVSRQGELKALAQLKDGTAVHTAAVQWEAHTPGECRITVDNALVFSTRGTDNTTAETGRDALAMLRRLSAELIAYNPPAIPLDSQTNRQPTDQDYALLKIL